MGGGVVGHMLPQGSPALCCRMPAAADGHAGIESSIEQQIDGGSAPAQPLRRHACLSVASVEAGWHRADAWVHAWAHGHAPRGEV